MSNDRVESGDFPFHAYPADSSENDRRLERRAAGIGGVLLLVGMALAVVLGLALVAGFFVLTTGISTYGSNK